MKIPTHIIEVQGIEFALKFTDHDQNGNVVAYCHMPSGKTWAKAIAPATPQAIESVCNFFDAGLRWHESKLRSHGEDFLNTL